MCACCMHGSYYIVSIVDACVIVNKLYVFNCMCAVIMLLCAVVHCTLRSCAEERLSILSRVQEYKLINRIIE